MKSSSPPQRTAGMDRSATDHETGYKTVAHTSFARLISFPFTAIATILTMTLTISYAGATVYAAISIVSTIALLFPYTDLGIGSGIINVISTTNAGDKRRLDAVASAIRILLISGFCVICIGIASTNIFSWKTVLGIKDAATIDIQSAVLIIFVLLAISIPLGIGQRILMGLMRNSTAILIGTITPLTGLLGTAVIVVTEMNFVYLAFPAAFGGVLAALVSTLIGLKSLDFKLKYVFSRDNHRMAGLVKNGLWFMMLSLSSALTLQFGRVILSMRSGLDQVAPFSLTMQMYSPIWSVFVAAGTALWPIFSRNRANKIYGQSRSIIKLLCCFAGAGVVSLVGLIILGPFAASFLSSGSILATEWLFASAGALLLAQSLQLVLGAFLTSPSDFRFQALWGVVAAGFTFLGSWIFAPTVGAAAPFIFAAVGIFLFSVIPSLIRAFRLSHKFDHAIRCPKS